MNYKLTLLLPLLLFQHFIFGQSDGKSTDFFELGFRTSHHSNSDFLNDPKYTDLMGDPLVDLTYFEPSGKGVNFAVKARYGKVIYNNVFLLGELGYFSRNEGVYCYCTNCDKVSYGIERFKKLHALDFGTGLRFQFLELRRINIALEFSGIYSLLINEPNFHYISYNFNPVFTFNPKKKVTTNLKFGVESSFGDYNKREVFAELAFDIKLQKKKKS